MGWKSQIPEEIGEIPEEECWDGTPGSLRKRLEHQSQIPEEEDWDPNPKIPRKKTGIPIPATEGLPPLTALDRGTHSAKVKHQQGQR